MSLDTVRMHRLTRAFDDAALEREFLDEYADSVRMQVRVLAGLRPSHRRRGVRSGGQCPGNAVTAFPSRTTPCTVLRSHSSDPREERTMRTPMALLFMATSLASAACVAPAAQQAAPCTSADIDMMALRKMVDEKNHLFTQAHITGDQTFLNTIFTHDARILPPDSEAVTGRVAIAAINAQYMKMGITEFREETDSFYGSNDYLIDEGHYVLRYGDVTDKGKYLNVWKKEDGDWKIHSNIWNSSAPAAKAK